MPRWLQSVDGQVPAIKAAFAEVYGGAANFVTPEAVLFGITDDERRCWELSRGYGLDRQQIFGLTVLQRGKSGAWERDPENSALYSSEWEALRAARQLGEKTT